MKSEKRRRKPVARKQRPEQKQTFPHANLVLPQARKCEIRRLRHQIGNDHDNNHRTLGSDVDSWDAENLRLLKQTQAAVETNTLDADSLKPLCELLRRSPESIVGSELFQGILSLLKLRQKVAQRKVPGKIAQQSAALAECKNSLEEIAKAIKYNGGTTYIELESLAAWHDEMTSIIDDVREEMEAPRQHLDLDAIATKYQAHPLLPLTRSDIEKIINNPRQRTELAEEILGPLLGVKAGGIRGIMKDFRKREREREVERRRSKSETGTDNVNG